MRREDGFKDQKLIVLTQDLRQAIQEDSLCRQLYFTDIGLFPKAEDHFIRREKGCEEYVVIFCFGGQGWCEFEGRRHEIESGQYFVLPPGKEHAYGSDEGGFWKKGWIHFSGKMAEEVVRKINKSSFGSGVPFNLEKEWFSRFNKMIDDLSLDSTFDNVAFNCSKLWPSFAELLYSERVLESSQNPIEKSLAYIHSNVKEMISLDELALVASLSVSRFCVLFKEKTGQSAKDYHIQLKIQQACRLLTMTNWSVKDIAQELGFDDPYYFSRCFKQKMGLSPRHFREQKAF